MKTFSALLGVLVLSGMAALSNARSLGGDGIKTTFTKDVRSVFRTIDENKDGVLDLGELVAFSKQLGIPFPDVPETEVLPEEHFSIDFNHFRQMMKSGVLAPTEEDFAGAFQMLDDDSDGFVSTKEIIANDALMGMATMEDLPEAVSTLIKTGDADGDHQLNYGEFVKVESQALSSLQKVLGGITRVRRSIGVSESHLGRRSSSCGDTCQHRGTSYRSSNGGCLCICSKGWTGARCDRKTPVSPFFVYAA